ncbi:MAG: hypothetical protein Q4E47_01145 [Candidatus Saccharibacteria bacterium]|nr:hypothetical protein [Candidatus Saccharibacteria bacterium]
MSTNYSVRCYAKLTPDEDFDFYVQQLTEKGLIPDLNEEKREITYSGNNQLTEVTYLISIFGMLSEHKIDMHTIH